MNYFSTYLFFLFIFFVIFSCKSESPKVEDIDIIGPEEIEDTSFYSGDAVKVTKIFYNVPSPLEMSLLLKRAGAYYNPDILNPIGKQDQYITLSSQALNFGVYGADLCYTRLFDQLQHSMDILAAVKKLSDGLGIPRGEGSIAISKLEEEQITNRDTLLKIIEETYADADRYLKQNNRGSTAAKIILGGWIEALYIATHILDPNKPDQEIMKHIAEQKYSLDNLIELIATYKDEKIMAEFLNALYRLKKKYDKIEIKKTKNNVIQTKDGITSIESKSEIHVTIDNINEISTIVDSIRTEIVK